MSAPSPHPRVVQEDVPETGECVLLDPERGRVLALNATAAAVWELLDGQRSPSDLAAALADAAGIDRAQAEADVRTLLARLAEEGFLA
ncbi:MAG: PqqD family protein [Planctomycetota bacterium]|nr:MAG: PqqD family protein [Planctomycetota bacterium]